MKVVAILYHKHLYSTTFEPTTLKKNLLYMQMIMYVLMMQLNKIDFMYQL